MEDRSVRGGGIVWMEDEQPRPSNSSNIDFNLDFTFNFNGCSSMEKGSSKIVKTRKVRKIKQKEFIGWGSKQLMEFLESINGISVDEEVVMSQSDVTDMINKYINDNHLIHPGKGKKKRVLCDLKLHALFGRKSISRIKIYDLLEPHFADNLILDDSDHTNSDDEDINNDDEDINTNNEYTNDDDDDDDDDTKRTTKKKYKKKKKSCISTGTGITTSSFAALIPANIKLVYLRKCVVLDIISKGNLDLLVGGFIRIKSDPNNYLQTNSHMLLQLIGVKKPIPNDDDDQKNTPTSTLLEVANSVKDVHVDMLSDDYFSLEELEDLRKRIKDGSVKRPTVVDFEEKARILHQDITKHWIARELSLLQNLIDRANEKGWRREFTLFDYIERRQLLQTPSEQSRLLEEVPKVFAEQIVLEVAVQNSEDNNVDDDPSPRSTNFMEVLKTPAYNIPKVFAEKIVPEVAVQNSEDNNVYDESSPRSTNPMEILETPAYNSPKLFPEDLVPSEVTVQNSEISDRTSVAVQERQVVNNENEGIAEKQVIDLSDDDEEEVKQTPMRIEDYSGIGEIWHYMDPQGVVQGPFSVTSLKSWSDADYFPPDFMVWKTTRHVEDALLLSDLLHHMFPPSSSC